MGSACSSNKKRVKKPKLKKAKEDANSIRDYSKSKDFEEQKQISLAQEVDDTGDKPAESSTPPQINEKPKKKKHKKNKKNKKEKKEKKSKNSKKKENPPSASSSVIEESSMLEIPIENSNSIEQDVAITGKVRSMNILPSRNKIKREQSSSSSSESGEVIEDDSEMHPNKIKPTEEIKKRGRSAIKSGSVKKSQPKSNSIIQLIEKANSENYEAVIDNLNKNQYSLKTGLMIPMEEFVRRNPEKEHRAATYLDYSAEDELYGVFKALETKQWKLFKYVFEKKGSIWNEKHLIPIIKYLIDIDWDEGLYELFKLNRTKEMYLSMYCNERKLFYDALKDICEDLVNEISSSNVLLYQLMEGLVLKPYSTLTFIHLFRYIHISGTKIQAKDVDPHACADDIYLMFVKNNNAFELAKSFDEACEGDIEEKKKYKHILTKLIDYSFVVMPSAIPISRIWRSIKIGSEDDFERCCQEAKASWPFLLTLRKSNATPEFKPPLSDDRVKDLFVNKWKPVHLMIYFARNKMIEQILCFAGRSLRKAMTIENKKEMTVDEYFPLMLAIKLQNRDTFKGLWNLAHQWSVMHLYQVMRDLKLPSMYSGDIFEVILTDKTTQDILNFCDTKIKNELFQIFEECIDENGRDEKLKTMLNDLKMTSPKPIKEITNESSKTITDESY
ncbi:unnamed protein product [Moneuplotes crassus]|uniref:Uncharacterized protein n=1 Tax=Euplotes crassus TaxID=5936 RepID=A0AAD1XVL2_EUPCR|nr:unnamed protein product [Moneuplotes crassus]